MPYLRTGKKIFDELKFSSYMEAKIKMETKNEINILGDKLDSYSNKGPAVVTFGEVMIRDMPADFLRPEFTNNIYISLAGSEFTLATMLARLNIPVAYVSRVPDNPYGWKIRSTGTSLGINMDHLVWAPKAEPIGRLIYEIGKTPRRSMVWYQRMHSSASKLLPGMVDWKSLLSDCKIFHTSGITFGLSNHSGYEKNYLYETFLEALENKPKDCLVGCDFNYRGSLWNKDQFKSTMTGLVKEHVDILITTIEDIAKLYHINCGKFSADEIDKGDFGPFDNDDLISFAQEVIDIFNLKILAITIRHPDTFEEHRWESAAMNSKGEFYRSEKVRKIILGDRLGGGDTWNGGFYYGLLTSNPMLSGIKKGVVVGDAGTRLKQTMMFDIPILDKAEIQNLIDSDIYGGSKRTER